MAGAARISQGVQLFWSALPQIGTHLGASLTGRETLYHLISPFISNQPPLALLVKDIKLVSAALDFAALCRILDIFTRNVGGFFRRDGKIFKLDEHNKRVEVSEDEWLLWERWKFRKIGMLGESTLTGQLDLCPMVDETENGNQLPTRAGITPFAYYWNRQRLKAYAYLFAAAALLQSNLSNACKCFALHSSFYLGERAQAFCLAGTYGLLGVNAFNRILLLHMQPRVQDLSKGRVKVDLSWSQAKEVAKCAANFMMCLFYMETVLTGRKNETLRWIGATSLIVTTVIRKMRKVKRDIEIKDLDTLQSIKRATRSLYQQNAGGGLSVGA